MTNDTQMYNDRLHIIKYYLKHRITVTALCTLFNRSRTWFYKWFNRYKRYGSAGLWNILRKTPAQVNRTPLDIEMNIIELIEHYPAYGPQRVANELIRKGVLVQSSAVYNVLKRHT